MNLRYARAPQGWVAVPLARATPEGEVYFVLPDGDEFAYNPNQPRDPKGSETGGQWSAAGTGASFVNGKWRTKDGKPVKQTIAIRLKALVIPPAWTDVRLNPSLTAPLQAKGVDAAGRTQYKYSAAFAQANSVAKFNRLKSYNKVHEQVGEQAVRDIQNKKRPAGIREAAAATYLIHQTGMRVGGTGDTGGAVKAYGASTLQVRHLKEGRNGELVFAFIGKKGISQRYVVADKDRVLTKFLEDPNRVYASPKDKLFRTSDAGVRDYFKSVAGSKYLVKDMRTWHGTAEAHRLVKSMKTPANPTQKKKQMKIVATKVAAILGNTPALALKSYIDPAVFKGW